MEQILDEVVPAEDLKKFEQKYHEEMLSGQVTLPCMFTKIMDPDPHPGLKVPTHR